VRFGDYCADFVVHARFTATSERLVVSPIWGAIADPSTMEQVAVNRIYRLLDEARRDEDVAKLLRAREMALRLGGRVGARLSAWLSMELGHREEDREVARAHYERSIRLATDVDEWNVAAALECIGVLRVESGEPPQWAFAPLFSHLERTFGPRHAVTVGWESDVIERMMDLEFETARAAWRALRPAFVGAFGEDDVTVAQLDAR
jgi:hypothetical protein